MGIKRRWSLRVCDSSGQSHMLVIEVPKGRGMVYASMGKEQVALPPPTVSRLIDAYRAAQTVAMQERGDW